jgi:hypothetical protein
MTMISDGMTAISDGVTVSNGAMADLEGAMVTTEGAITIPIIVVMTEGGAVVMNITAPFTMSWLFRLLPQQRPATSTCMQSWIRQDRPRDGR